MRFILAFALCLSALSATAQDRNVVIKRVYGAYEVTYFPNALRVEKAKVCTKFKPPASKKNAAPTSLSYACLDCSVLQMYRCKPHPTKTEKRRVSGFEIARRDGKVFALNNNKISRLLRRYCNASQGRLWLALPAGGTPREPSAKSWFRAKCS